jgi:hypothetical protein
MAENNPTLEINNKKEEEASPALYTEKLKFFAEYLLGDTEFKDSNKSLEVTGYAYNSTVIRNGINRYKKHLDFIRDLPNIQITEDNIQSIRALYRQGYILLSLLEQYIDATEAEAPATKAKYISNKCAGFRKELAQEITKHIISDDLHKLLMRGTLKI